MPSLFCRAGKKKVVLELGGNGPPAEASKAAAAARLIAVARWRHANGLLVSGVVTMLALAFLLIVSGSLIIAVHNAPQYFRGLAAAERGEIPWQEYLLVVAQGKTIAQFSWRSTLGFTSFPSS